MLWSFRRAQQVRTVLTYASLRSKPLRMTNVRVLTTRMLTYIQEDITVCMRTYTYMFTTHTHTYIYTYMQSAPKAYLCCGFIPCEENEMGGPNSFDMIAGGSNGNTINVCMYVCMFNILLIWLIIGKMFLFEKASCALVKPILKGKIQCLDVLMGSNAGMYIYIFCDLLELYCIVLYCMYVSLSSGL